jgi:hypothetical protein
MTRHLDDVDLLALASGHRDERDRLYRHWANCPVCQSRQAYLTSLMPPMAVVSGKTAPEWDFSRVDPRPVVRNTLPRRRRGLVYLVALAAAAFFYIWPHLIWAEAPSGPVALWAYMTGTRVEMVPDVPRVGSVSLVISSAGWTWVQARVSPPRPHTVYEAWWIVGHRHLRANVFRPTRSHGVSFWIPGPRRPVNAVGVTLEPAPGTMVPTGPRLFFARLPR